MTNLVYQLKREIETQHHWWEVIVVGSATSLDEFSAAWEVAFGFGVYLAVLLIEPEQVEHLPHDRKFNSFYPLEPLDAGVENEVRCRSKFWRYNLVPAPPRATALADREICGSIG